MTTTTIEATSNGVRTISGRRIEKTGNGDVVRWEQVERFDPVVTEHFDAATGVTTRKRHQRPPFVHWRAVSEPRRTMEVLAANLAGWPFDPREPDPEHDEYEQLLKVSTFFAAKFAAQFKIHPRPDLPGISLGKCFKARGILKLGLGDSELRELLHRHKTGDWGAVGRLDLVVLDDDKRWVPPLFSQDVQNAVAVEAGRGLVRSTYPHMAEPGRGVEMVQIVTLINESTFCYCPTRDCI